MYYVHVHVCICFDDAMGVVIEKGKYGCIHTGNQEFQFSKPRSHYSIGDRLNTNTIEDRLTIVEYRAALGLGRLRRYGVHGIA